MSPSSGGFKRAATNQSDRVRPLPDETSSLLRSTIVIPSIPCALLELVCNSIDAGATKIDCTINLNRWTIKCEDNGSGIEAHVMDKIARGGGHVFDRGWTTKHGSTSTVYGSRGEALASLASIGLLEVTTLAGGDSSQTRQLVVKGGQRFQGAAQPARASRGTTIHVASTSDGLLGRWKQLWGRNGIEDVRMFELSDRNTEQEATKAVGFFSMSGSHSKQAQYVFINSRPVDANGIHKTINRAFGSSSFSAHAASLLADFANSGAKTRSSNSNRKKPLERFPVFVIMLEMPPDLVEFSLEPERRSLHFSDESRVLSLVEGLANAFLIQEGFKAVPVPLSEAAETFTPLEALLAEERSPKRARRNNLPQPPALVAPVLSPFGSTELEWRDPVSGQRARIDRRTGYTYQAPIRDSTGRRDLLDTSRLRRTPSSANPSQYEAPAWLHSSLRGWSNPCFVTSKPSITSIKTVKADAPSGQPRRPASTPGPYTHAVENDRLSNSLQATIASFFESRSRGDEALFDDVEGLGQMFDVSALEGSEFITQVDHKFLLVKMKTKSKDGIVDSLVLVDQHAASERVRVEGFFQNFCRRVATGQDVKTVLLGGAESDNFVVAGRRYVDSVVVSKQEAHQLDKLREDLQRWGIGIHVPEMPCPSSDDDSSDSIVTDYIQVQVTSLPDIVADRLLQEPRLLQDFVRSVAQDGTPSNCVRTVDSDLPWHAVVRQCPSILIDLINSKACRGAIMFNDELTPDQCRKLLKQLAKTTFPFQCAHGRPSLVPLVNLPADSNNAQFSHARVDWSRWTS
ncbi:DNA mismatch repair protein [Microbotryomycetes sp. JL221]|nr:DNA mismatch repair protein [Microbotryomycetes sp. JL221]